MIHYASSRKNELILKYLLENYSSDINNYVNGVPTDVGFFEIPGDNNDGHLIRDLMKNHAKKTKSKKIAKKLSQRISELEDEDTLLTD